MSNKSFPAAILIYLLCVLSCSHAQTVQEVMPTSLPVAGPPPIMKIRNEARVIHVLVALCDNDNQGIVPVPRHLGNGEDTEKNLYWGAGYGVKSYFTRCKSWQKVAEYQNPKPNVLQRLVFKHRFENAFIVADAYRGSKMKETVDDFFSAVSGKEIENVEISGKMLQILGSANLVAFVGHNGLMDFDLKSPPNKVDDEKRDAIILACASWNYFAKHLKKTNAQPLLWTSNLMAPEAYTLHDALEGWIRNETGRQIRVRAAAAYAKYQKISQKAVGNLFVTGY